MAAAAAPPTFDWMSDPLDFEPAKAEVAKEVLTKSVTRPLDPRLALLMQRAKVPERSPTVYAVYPQTPDNAAATTTRPKKKALDVRERIAKKLRAGAPKISKRWHADGLERAVQRHRESVARLLAGRVEPFYVDE